MNFTHYLVQLYLVSEVISVEYRRHSTICGNYVILIVSSNKDAQSTTVRPYFDIYSSVFMHNSLSLTFLLETRVLKYVTYYISVNKCVRCFITCSKMCTVFQTQLLCQNSSNVCRAQIYYVILETSCSTNLCQTQGMSYESIVVGRLTIEQLNNIVDQ